MAASRGVGEDVSTRRRPSSATPTNARSRPHEPTSGRWVTNSGSIECREALASRATRSGRAAPPGRCRGRRRTRRGHARRPCPVRHGAARCSGLPTSPGCGRRARTVCSSCGPVRRLRESRRGAGGSGLLTMDLTVLAGSSHDLALEIGYGAAVRGRGCCRVGRHRGELGPAVPELSDCLDPPDVRHSYAVLRGLTGAAGGMVAAATTRLPHRAEEGRNYDDRYVWIRDQCCAGEAMATVGGSTSPTTPCASSAHGC
jgi:hypothetical protein